MAFCRRFRNNRRRQRVTGRRSTGSRENRRRPLVEDACSIDLLDRRWKSALCLHRACGTFEWRGPGSNTPKEWIDFRLSPIDDDGTRTLVLDFTRDAWERQQVIVIERVRIGFSERWYARCPGSCDRLARKLFVIPGQLAVACWRCSGLAYRSSQQHDHRVDRCRRNPAEFVKSRSHLSSVRSRAVTAWILLKAEHRGFRARAI